MKANTPEKLYLHPTANGEVGASWLAFPLTDEDVEYTRTDAFVEKACKFFNENLKEEKHRFIFSKWTKIVSDYHKSLDSFLDTFINYMKGE